MLAKFAGGEFSHAAIYIGLLQIFDARPSGVGYDDFNLVNVEAQGNGNLHQFCKLSAYEHLAVFRLPASNTPRHLDSFGRRAALKMACDEYDGWNYSILPRLAKASAATRAAPRTSSALMGLFGRAAMGDQKKGIARPVLL